MKISYIILFLFTLLISCGGDDNSSFNVPNNSNPLEFEYQLIWEDEFNGNSINNDNWAFVLMNAGTVNSEWQNYVENTDNYKVENGVLHITAQRTGDNGFGGYTSTRLSSKQKQEFKYGRIEFKIKAPSGRGTWGGVWMLGSNRDEVGWPNCGEIDVLEYVGFQPNTIHNNIHTESDYNVTNNGIAKTVESVEEEFHVYGITWTADKIEFYLDDPTNITNSYSPSNPGVHNWPFAQDFYLLLNLAVGGTWGGKQGVDGDIWPQSLLVDYVRVYQLRLIE